MNDCNNCPYKWNFEQERLREQLINDYVRGLRAHHLDQQESFYNGQGALYGLFPGYTPEMMLNNDPWKKTDFHKWAKRKADKGYQLR